MGGMLCLFSHLFLLVLRGRAGRIAGCEGSIFISLLVCSGFTGAIVTRFSVSLSNEVFFHFCELFMCVVLYKCSVLR